MASLQAPHRRPIRTVAFVSLGCPKNLVDSEKMLGLLAEDGLTPTADEDHADALVVNTCGFLEASKDESLQVIREAAERKREGRLQRLIVAGCLVQRHRARMLEWCPDIDAMIGVFDRDRIVEAVRGGQRPRNDLGLELPVYSSIAGNAAVARRDRGLTENPAPGYFESDTARLRLTPRHYAYLRMSEGCNQNCAFCTIPSIRGKMRSKPIAAVVAEMRELMNDGAFEINLIGQDTTSYGRDIDEPAGLVGLLESLDAVAAEFGGAWVRLMYAYPSTFSNDMIHALARLPHLVKYIDMPLQHIADRVLDRMRRRTSRRLIEGLIARLRESVPGIVIRTTFISGFPDETEAEHEELLEFIEETGFDAMGVFPYSPEPGTPAGSMHARGEAVPAEVVTRRVEQLMLAQQRIAFDRAAAWASQGREMDVLIDAPTSSRSRATAGVGKGGSLHRGRHAGQAPDIDGTTFVQSKKPRAPGELVRCRVVHSDGYDLIAQPLDDARRSIRLAGPSD